MNQQDREALAEALCAVIAGALPAARRGIKWNAPSFDVAGQDMITLNLPPKGAVRVIFHRGAKAVDSKTGLRLVSDDSGRLTWASDQRAHASFADAAAVADGADWLRGFCRLWVAAAAG